MLYFGEKLINIWMWSGHPSAAPNTRRSNCSGSWRTSTSSNANAVVWADPAYSKKFLEEHREQITLHKAAKVAFDEASLKKLPKVKELDAEYSALLSQKKAAYPAYRKARDEMQELKKAQKNVELFFAEEKDPKEKSQTR